MRPKPSLLSLLLCLLVSGLAHLAVTVFLPPLGTIDVSAPLDITLAPAVDAAVAAGAGRLSLRRREGSLQVTADGAGGRAGRENEGGDAGAVGGSPSLPDQRPQGPEGAARTPAAFTGYTTRVAAAPRPSLPASSEAGAGPRIRQAEEFLAAQREKLTYRVSMFGLPVGSAVVEGAREGNDLRFTVTIRSSEPFSRIYPVSDFAETRIIGGRYVIATRRQQEGDLRRDTGFTLCLQEGRSVWADRLANVVVTRPLAARGALDVLSAFYFLRAAPLAVGETQVVEIFDENETVATPVEVLRKERIRLPGVREAETIVVRPLLQTDGLFRRSGEILMWLTADQYRVPVRVEAAIPLGTATAELVSAETTFPPRTP